MITSARQPGELVKVRGREWVVLPSADPDLILLKPLGGTDEEITAIFRPLGFTEDTPGDFNFPYPVAEDIGNYASSKLLFNATRLAFRNGAGPFRSFGKLSFRPRAYQLVPLIMALRQQRVRLMIADDVGIGKTIEAGLIVRELLDRGEINRFAVICLPHLCEQWQAELKDKFGIESVIIRSGTISGLERELPGTESIYRYYPYQIISVDYVKSDNNSNKSKFIHDGPDFIVVDEAHTCSSDATNPQSAQQLRYLLLKELSGNEKKNLLLLTATPHSGKQAQFQSLLGLIKPEFGLPSFDITQGDNAKKVAENFVQRRRIDILDFLETNTFPERVQLEDEYSMHPEYMVLFNKVIAFAREMVKDSDSRHFKQRMKFWAALSLLRGVMSSPQAGAAMLRTRASKLDEEGAVVVAGESTGLFDKDTKPNDDELPRDILGQQEFSQSEIQKLSRLASELEDLSGLQKDHKAASAFKMIEKWLGQDRHVVVFCRYIETANYLGQLARSSFSHFKKLEVAVVTGEIHDEQRKEMIEHLGKAGLRLLICTDCLSEGVNLQNYFNALVHYDLPWNPNRLEQREGRIDRFGQPEEKVYTHLLVGKNNPMDGVVLRVLLRKAKEIRRNIGITVPFPEDSQSVLEAVLNAVLLNPQTPTGVQGTLFDDPAVVNSEKQTSAIYENECRQHEALRSRFAQTGIIKKLDIEDSLLHTDRVLGKPDDVRDFVLQAVEHLKGQIFPTRKGYKLFPSGMPGVIQSVFKGKQEVLLSFYSPTPEGYLYIGRNHALVEQLCNYILGGAFDREHSEIVLPRASVFRCAEVQEKTVLVQFRMRNVIQAKSENRELVAEEVFLWGYRGKIEEGHFLDATEAHNLLVDAKPVSDFPLEERQRFLKTEAEIIENSKKLTSQLARERSKVLVDEHERYRKALGIAKYDVGAVIPPDVLGLYIFYPVI
jgi:superfamily II DNA or RNA helicase